MISYRKSESCSEKQLPVSSGATPLFGRGGKVSSSRIFGPNNISRTSVITMQKTISPSKKSSRLAPTSGDESLNIQVQRRALQRNLTATPKVIYKHSGKLQTGEEYSIKKNSAVDHN